MKLTPKGHNWPAIHWHLGRGPGASEAVDFSTSPAFLERSIAIFRDEEASGGAVSFETDPASDRSLAIMNLAESDTERFVELVSFLSPVVQDVLFQYYLLGRTYAQIGAVLFPNKTTVAAQVLVKTANKLGVRALGGVIKCGGAPSREQAAKYPEAAEAYNDMHAFSVRLPDVPTVNLKTPGSFGQFAVTPNGDLSELFPPSWSVLRCRGIGKRNPETP